MKSFFKKVALLLVLAMVVTMLPAAKPVVAADGPLMCTYLKLYIDGDYTETYGDHKNAWVKYDKETYTLSSFVSSDEDVVTVGRWGKVEAVGVGRATVTATFTDRKTGDEVKKKCTVDVKRNAVEIALSDYGQKKLAEGLEIGDTYQTAVSRTNAEGTVTWKRVKVTDKKEKWATEGITTSALIFESNDTDVFTVDKNGKITAVGEGEAILKIWAVQSEKPDTVDGKTIYKQVTPEQTYTVKVLPGKIEEVKQTTTDTFAILCSNENVASKINLNNLSVVYAANGADITDYVKSVSVSADENGVKRIVNVTLHNGIRTGVTYKVTYDETTLEFVGAELTPASIKITTGAVKANEDEDVKVAVYNADGVDITAASDASRISISAPESTDYYVNPIAKQIYFFSAGKKATVTATYDMYWDEQGNKLTDLTSTVEITSYELATSTGNISAWLVTDKSGDAGDAGKYNNNPVTLAAGDTGFVLYGLYVKTTGDKNENKFTNSGEVAFSYSSTNENVLLVDPTNGALYPVAAGTAGIIVKNGDAVVGVCNINVVANRTFNTFSVDPKGTKLSAGIDHKIEVGLTVKDQLNRDIEGYSVKAEQIKTSNNEVAVVRGYDAGGKVYIEATDAANDLTGPRTVYVKITVNAYGVEKSLNVPVTVKKVDTNAISSYSIKVSRDSIDLKLDKDKLTNNEYRSTISVEYYDAAGFYLGTVTDLTKGANPADGKYGFVVTKNGQELNNTTDAVVSGTDLVAITTTNASGSSEVTKLNTGSYLVRVYKGIGSRAQLIGNTVINVTDSTVALTAVQDKQNVVAETKEAICAALTFKRGNDTITNLTPVDMDYTSATNGDSVFVKTITVHEAIGTYTWEIVVPVYKLFKIKP